MNRRQRLKSGLVLAGGSLLASVTGMQNIIATNIGKSLKDIVSTSAFPGRGKSGRLEVSGMGPGIQNLSCNG